MIGTIGARSASQYFWLRERFPISSPLRKYIEFNLGRVLGIHAAISSRFRVDVADTLVGAEKAHYLNAMYVVMNMGMKAAHGCGDSRETIPLSFFKRRTYFDEDAQRHAVRDVTREEFEVVISVFRRLSEKNPQVLRLRLNDLISFDDGVDTIVGSYDPSYPPKEFKIQNRLRDYVVEVLRTQSHKSTGTKANKAL